MITTSTTPDHRVRLCDGRLFDPWEPSGAPVNYGTVAYGMSNLCRYGGHVSRFYSVAEHSLWVMVSVIGEDDSMRWAMANSLAQRGARVARHHDALGTRLQRCAPYVALRGLLALVHDAPEALGLVDVLGPVKRRPEMREYAAADLRCLSWLCDGWGLPNLDGGGDEEKRRTHADLWFPIWAADTAIMGAEYALRPWSDGTGSGEHLPPWPWLDLVGRHRLHGGDSFEGREWVRRALCLCWDALRSAAGLPSLPATLPVIKSA